MSSNSIDTIRTEVSQVLAASDEPRRSPSPTPDQCYVNSVIKQLDTLYGEYAGTLAVSPTWCLCCSPSRNPTAPVVCSSDAISDLSVRTHASLYLLQHPNPSTTMLSFLRKFGPDLAKSFQNPGPWLVPRLASLAMFLQTILSAWEGRAAADAAAATNSAATATATITNALRATKRYIVRAMAERVGPTHPLAVLCEAIFDSSSAHRAHSVVTHALQQYASAVQSWYEGDSTVLEHYDAQTRLALVAQMDAMTLATENSAAPETNDSSSGKRRNSNSSSAEAEAEVDAKAATAASASAVRMLQHGIHGVRHSFALVDEAARMQSLAWSYWIVANAYAGAGDAQRAEEAFMASMHHTYRLYAAADTQSQPPEAAMSAMSPTTSTANGEQEAKAKHGRGQNESWQPGRMGCHYGARGIVSLYRSQRAWGQCEAASRLAVQTYAGLFGRRDLRTLEMVHVLGDCLAQQGKDSESAALLRQWGPDFADAG